MTFQDEWEIPFKNWLYQLQNADPSEIASSGFELAVIDYSRDGSEKGEYSQEEIKIMLDAGVVPVAYLNIGQAEDYRFYWKMIGMKIPLSGLEKKIKCGQEITS